jgi:hypothetical protein
VSANNLFPRRSDIFKGTTLDIRDSVARPSLDTLYQVTFSFGKVDKWLENNLPGKKRTQGFDFKRKMSLLCTQAEIPGTNFTKLYAIGHHQGIQEEFPEVRNFPPLNLTFYCDADMVILEILESWMTYINPVQNGLRNLGAYTRFNYPDDYKEIIHLTKFERDTFSDKPGEYKSNLSSYEFVNIWPTDLTSMRLAYGDPNVLQCSVQFSYDRFFTKFNYEDSNQSVLNTSNGTVNSNDQLKRIGSGLSPSQQAKVNFKGGNHYDLNVNT